MDLKEVQSMQLSVMKEIHAVCVKHKLKYYLIGGSALGAIRHKGFIPWDDDIDIAFMRKDYELFKQVFYKEFDQTKYFLQSYDTDVDIRAALMRLCIKGTLHDHDYERHLHNCKNTYIDIFPLDNVPNNPKERKKHSKDNKTYSQLLVTKLYLRRLNWRQYFNLPLVARYIYTRICPLHYLQQKKEKCMRKYENSLTDCVASMESHYSYERQTMQRSIYGTPVLMQFEDTQLYVPEKTHEYLTNLFGDDYMQLPPEDKREMPCDIYIKD